MMESYYSDCIDQIFQINNVGRGKLKYIGGVDGKQGVFCGIDLLAPQLGKNNGYVDGKQYFSCEYEKSGLFVPFSKMKYILDAFKGQNELHPNGLIEAAHLVTPSNKTIDNSVNSPESIELQTQAITENNKLIAKYEQDISFLNNLVQEQQTVIENAQPVIVEYDEKVHVLEMRVANLQEALGLEKDSAMKQKLMFEKEHDQLLALVEGLQEQLKVQQEKLAEPANLAESDEFTKYREQQELYKKKWDKERDTLKMQNASLNTEYSNLYKEMSQQESLYEDKIKLLKARIEELSNSALEENIENQENADTKEINPFNNAPSQTNKLETPSKTLSEEVWCGLCEKQGHDSIECKETL